MGQGTKFKYTVLSQEINPIPIDKPVHSTPNVVNTKCEELFAQVRKAGFSILVRFNHRPTKNFVVKRQRMLNRFGVKLGALSLKMHLVLPNWLYFWRYFTFIFL